MLKRIIMVLAVMGVTGGAWAAETQGDYGAGELFKRVDTDHDGRISLQEHLKASEERARRSFERMDTNGDGYIDAKEAEAARAKVRERLEQLKQRRSKEQ